MAAQVKLRVFSLNCWGIHFLSNKCAQRYEMIGDLLEREHHDIVLLQEVWSERDFLFLKRKLVSSHPYSHYFRSGVIGSGLAVFSKHHVQDALLSPYTLNGYPFMVHHGDWFGGKAVGLVILDVFGLKTNVYITHLHAEYSRTKDDYLPHRIVQSWELLQFVRHTTGNADVVIVGGDLNMHPKDLGNRLIRAHTGLRDCYLDTNMFEGCEEGITLIADNHFTKKQDLIPFEKGIRIDYILIKGSGSVNVRCESMSTTKGSVPDKPFPYSDHEALTTELVILCSEGTASCMPVSEQINTTVQACAVVKEGLDRTEALQVKAMRMLAAGLLLLLLQLLVFCSGGCASLSMWLLGAACLGLLVSGTLLYIFFTMQLKALREAEAQMKLSSANLQARLSGLSGSVPSLFDCSPKLQREE
ncbi:sphingomyelin phosphodiesterase 2a [Electrophorus electricus]|uniref:sphingomyelin phosphodiesterase 2a n=1 Tax=Electrophorus electricus TaxID=8005 RepID=UPI000F0A1771|nr:sphingomyelin phosphodiesterase 2a [Electrophorus electricus]